MAKPRVLISSDIGGADPDDIQSMVHAFLYADKMNLVGLVSTPSKHGGRASHINQVIDSYAKDYATLKTWSNDYPTPEYLKSITRQGSISVAPSKGWNTPTEGSKQIIKAAHAASASDPLWVLTWGSMTDLAQALHDDPSIKSKIKVYSIGSWNTQQDPAARDYIYNSHKDLWWIENNSSFRGMYVDDNGNGKNSWNMNDAKGHGALGEHFHKAMPWGLKMGDTPSILYLIDGADNNNPSANSWGGAFVKTGHGPNYWTDNKASSLANGGYHGSETVQKHQAAFYKDFAMRLDRAKTAKSGDTPEQKDPPPAKENNSPPPVNSGKDNPVVAGDDNYKVSTNEAKSFNSKHLLLNDTGKDGDLKVTEVAGKSAAGATVTWGKDGTVKYTPLKDWQGKDSISYTVADKDGDEDTGTIFIQVGNGGGTVTQPSSNGGVSGTPPVDSGKNNPVVAVDDSYKTGVDQKWYFNTKYLTWNDKGADGGLKVSAVAGESAAGATVSLDSNGTAIYTPLKGWQGKDTIEYTLIDKDGSTDTGLVHMQVGNGTAAPVSDGSSPPVPSAPSTGGNTPVMAVDDHYKIAGGKSHYFNARHLLENDKGADGDLKVTDIPDHSAKGARVTLDDDGTVIYRPKPGVGKDWVSYTVADKDGSTDSGTIHFDVLLA